MSANTIFLIVKRAGEVALRAKGHPAVIIASGIAVGIGSITRTISKHREARHGSYKKPKTIRLKVIRPVYETLTLK